jgi:hypothetical protein
MKGHDVKQMKGHDVKQHPDEDELLGKLLRSLPPEMVLKHYTVEQRLAGLSLEERLAGLSLEERLAGLSLEQTLLVVPDEALRCLSDEYVRSLPRSLQTAIRRRLSIRH